MIVHTLEVMLYTNNDAQDSFTMRYVSRKFYNIWVRSLNQIYTPILRINDAAILIKLNFQPNEFVCSSRNTKTCYIGDTAPLEINEDADFNSVQVYLGSVSITHLIKKRYQYVSARYIIYAYVCGCIDYKQYTALINYYY